MLAMVSVWMVIHWYNLVSTMTTAEEALVSMCDERARMLQDQFAVSVNHVHALAILISTFHYQKNPSAMDQVSFLLRPLVFSMSKLKNFLSASGSQCDLSRALFTIHFGLCWLLCLILGACSVDSFVWNLVVLAFEMVV